MRLRPHRPPCAPQRAARALTLLEVMIVIAIVGVLIALVAPSMREMIGMQRLRATAAQLVTDVQFGRSEAVSRNQYVGFSLRNIAAEAMTCYVLFTSDVNPLQVAGLDASKCNCTATPGSACVGTQREVRTVQVARDLGLELRKPAPQQSTAAFNPVSGGIMPAAPVGAGGAPVAPGDFCLEVTRRPRGRLRVTISAAGRPTTCSPDLSVPGYDACPPVNLALNTCAAIPAP
ncbi:MAG: GspH/FimT family pseudopilin [Burkholderiales bacterium]|nr:GspH/FimT family pseudopilin [Burkholderiales bacterium]